MVNEQRKEYLKRWYLNNKERLKPLRKASYLKYRSDRIKADLARYYANHIHNKQVQVERRRQLAEIVFTHYGKVCACCGESITMLLTIDHIHNDGASHRKSMGKNAKNLYSWLVKEGFPKGFQVLCYNCNIGKYKNGGICPHKSGN